MEAVEVDTTPIVVGNIYYSQEIANALLLSRLSALMAIHSPVSFLLIVRAQLYLSHAKIEKIFGIERIEYD
jgi:hypothetical protein